MQTNISTLRDDQLLGLIRRRHEDPDSAADAWAELYRRHVKFIYWRVERAANFVGRGLAPEDVVEQTFAEVYLRAADGFKPGNYKDEAAARRHVRAWLGRISHFELLGLIQSRAHESISVRDPDVLSMRVDPAHPSEIAPKASDAGTKDLVRIAEAVLNPDELEIVWLKMQYYNADNGESWVPPAEIELVCQKQGITNDVFRKRYERALNKIKEATVNEKSASTTYNRRI